MDDTTRRKLNILIHLARVDGKFHKAERRLLVDFVENKGIDPNEFYLLEEKETAPEPGKIKDKSEMMFLALKLIQADGEIAVEEEEYIKGLAKKLGYKEEIVTEMAGKFDLTRSDFDQAEKQFTA